MTEDKEVDTALTRVEKRINECLTSNEEAREVFIQKNGTSPAWQLSYADGWSHACRAILKFIGQEAKRGGGDMVCMGTLVLSDGTMTVPCPRRCREPKPDVEKRLYSCPVYGASAQARWRAD